MSKSSSSRKETIPGVLILCGIRRLSFAINRFCFLSFSILQVSFLKSGCWHWYSLESIIPDSPYEFSRLPSELSNNAPATLMENVLWLFRCYLGVGQNTRRTPVGQMNKELRRQKWNTWLIALHNMYWKWSYKVVD